MLSAVTVRAPLRSCSFVTARSCGHSGGFEKSSFRRRPWRTGGARRRSVTRGAWPTWLAGAPGRSVGGQPGETGRLGLALTGAAGGGGAKARLRRGLRALVPPPPVCVSNRGRKAVSSVRPNTRERAGGALTRGGLRLPIDPWGLCGVVLPVPSVCGPPSLRRGRRPPTMVCCRPPRPASHRRAPWLVPYIRAGKSWRLVREDFSKEGAGDEPEEASGSSPTSGAPDRDPDAASPQPRRRSLSLGYPMAGLALVFAWFSQEGKGEGGRTQAAVRTVVVFGGPTSRPPQAGTARRFGHRRTATAAFAPLPPGWRGSAGLCADLPSGAGAGADPRGPPGVRGPPGEATRATGAPSPAENARFRPLFGPSPAGGSADHHRTTTAAFLSPPRVRRGVGRPAATRGRPAATSGAPRPIDFHVNEKRRSTSRKKSAFSGVFDLTSVSAVPENPPEVSTSSYIPPGGSYSQKTRIYQEQGGRGELCPALHWPEPGTW